MRKLWWWGKEKDHKYQENDNHFTNSKLEIDNNTTLTLDFVDIELVNALVKWFN